MKILFAASEIFPFAKSGGLADIAFALPKALSKSYEMYSVMPLYRFVDRKKYNILSTKKIFYIKLDEIKYKVELYSCNRQGVKTLFVYNELLCDRDHLYGPLGGAYEDNDLRFAIFCNALIEIAKIYKIDLLHLNDWHTALAAFLLQDSTDKMGGVKVKVIYTIHNLAYQGIFPKTSLKRDGIDIRHFDMNDMEFYGQVNWMKAGIAHSDFVTTVSPSYAKEIQSEKFGCGLDGFLRKYSYKIVGILNGIDTDLFNPERDDALFATFDEASGKYRNKEKLLKKINMPNPDHPLFVFIGRLTEQKGISILIEALKIVLKWSLNVMIVGEGDDKYHKSLSELSKKYNNINIFFGYDEDYAHRLYAAADFFLMPSVFEPCGLGQMIAMRYGAIPIVHAVGGLKDSVHDYSKSNECGLGLIFENESTRDFIQKIGDAKRLYSQNSKINQIANRDMKCDFSIRKCAYSYKKLYMTDLVHQHENRCNR